MRVLFWIDSFPTVSETFIRNQIVDLINEGIDVLILCNFINENNKGLEGFEQYSLLKKTTDTTTLVPQKKNKKIKFLSKVLVCSFLTDNFWYYIKFIRLFFLDKKKYPLNTFFILNFILKQKVDVIHCHFGPIGNEAAFIKKIGVPVKLICTFHGYDIRLGIKKGKSVYKDLFYFADFIISISNYNREKLLSFGLQYGKIKNLNNGVEVYLTENKKHQKGQLVKILSVGRLVDEKGYDFALNAIALFTKKHPEIHFHYDIIGGGELEHKLIKKSNDLCIDKFVTFHFAQNSEYVKNKMLQADFLFLPSVQEAMPMVVLEAQSFGLPVLGTDVGAVKDLIIDDVTGFLSPVSVVGIMEGLEMMFASRDKWEMYGFNAKKNIILNYDKTFLVKELIETYKN